LLLRQLLPGHSSNAAPAAAWLTTEVFDRKGSG
jgi:hypothetical protein